MQKFKIVLEIPADDIMQASLVARGVQNVLNELESDQLPFIIELANPQTAKTYKDKLMSIVNNPIVKGIVGKL